jgi:hypothetical protein
VFSDAARSEITIANPKGAEAEAPKGFTFDMTYGPEATQRGIYDVTAAPIVESVLQGFNGTIFAVRLGAQWVRFDTREVGSRFGRGRALDRQAAERLPQLPLPGVQRLTPFLLDNATRSAPANRSRRLAPPSLPPSLPTATLVLPLPPPWAGSTAKRARASRTPWRA